MLLGPTVMPSTPIYMLHHGKPAIAEEKTISMHR